MPQTLVRYSKILEIVGDIIRVQVPESAHQQETGPHFNDLAVVETRDGELSLAQVINLKENTVALQVFRGTKGVSTDSSVQFLGRPMEATYSDNILGRVFRGTGEPIDGGPDLSQDSKVPIGGPSVNPMRRILAINLALEAALDLAWKTLSECFEPQELLMKQALIDKYFPKNIPMNYE